MMDNSLKIARKEFASFFSSSIAFIFLGAFLGACLFLFFWVEKFFARNIADVRPLFEWMPLLLVFLVSAVTMRMWSEERRSGTLEFLLTAPVSSVDLVLGKFIACIGLVLVALALTLPLPITVSLMGPLDWGPVFGGYVAAVFLASAYVAIGLFISSRATNQIVSLILTSAVCGGFYLIGTDALTGLFGTQTAELLKLLGSGSRFEAITRGVIDLRDLYYYVSIVGVFLTLNVLALEWLRWAGNASNRNHRRWSLISALLIANFLAANVWLAPVNGVRSDLTKGNVYSISNATRGYLGQLREPLLVRGYFSAKTHPLLSPLVPRLRDLLQEYAVASDGRVRVEFIDPMNNPALEKEANEKYQIKPIPFQFASKYQATVVNSYFDILIQYGDQHEVLSFTDLIEVKSQSEADLKVELRNPEYDITQAIKKVLYSYQSAGQLFDNIQHPIQFKGYISASDALPEILKNLRKDLEHLLDERMLQAGGKLLVNIQDPDDQGGALANKIIGELGFKPMVASPTDPKQFWFYMTLEEGDDTIIQIPLPEKYDKATLERSLDAALKRFSKGFLKTVALNTPAIRPFKMGAGKDGIHFDWLRNALLEEHSLRATDLKNGRVPGVADILLLASPGPLDKTQLFAVDQFLMRGGAVIVATSPFNIDVEDGLNASLQDSELLTWLGHHGITIDKKMVLDPQNSSFPLPVTRNVGGHEFKETQMLNYPYFVDIRSDGIGKANGLTSGVDQITMTWPSPIILDEIKNTHRQVLPILESTDKAWLSNSLQIQPDFEHFSELGFAVASSQEKHLLAVSVEGRFNSYFKDQASPLSSNDNQESVFTGIIGRSAESARIIVFSSSSFLTDSMLNLAASGMGTRYLKPVQLLENTIDWAMEDRGLLSIRGRTHFSRILKPLNHDAQIFWEYLNYGLALFGLMIIAFLRMQVKGRATRRYLTILKSMDDGGSHT